MGEKIVSRNRQLWVYEKNSESKNCQFWVFQTFQRTVRFHERTSKDLAVF
jgi:hypothetical protein